MPRQSCLDNLCRGRLRQSKPGCGQLTHGPDSSSRRGALRRRSRRCLRGRELEDGPEVDGDGGAHALLRERVEGDHGEVGALVEVGEGRALRDAVPGEGNAAAGEFVGYSLLLLHTHPVALVPEIENGGRLGSGIGVREKFLSHQIGVREKFLNHQIVKVWMDHTHPVARVPALVSIQGDSGREEWCWKGP